MIGWRKATILGGIWGLISGLFVLMAIFITFGEHQPFSSKIKEIIAIILFLPGFISMSTLNLINFSPYFKVRLILIVSTLFGAFLGLGIYKLYKKSG